MPGLARFLTRRQRYRLPAPANWIDVGPTVRKFRLRSVAWGFAVGARRTVYLVLAAQLLTAHVTVNFIAVTLSLVVILLLTSYKLYHPVFGRRFPFRSPLSVARTPAAAAGLILRTGAQFLTVALLVFYLLVAGMYTEGGQGGNWGMQAAVKIRERVKLRQNDWQDILGQLVLALSDHPLVGSRNVITNPIG